MARAAGGPGASPPLGMYTTRVRTPEEARRTFAPARPMPGVVPESHLAMDEYDTGLMGAYNAQFNGGGGGGGEFGEGIHWLGFPYLAELSQRGEYRRIVETTAREMTRSWINVTKTGGEDAARVEIINNQLKYHRVRDKFRRVAELDGYFGRGHIYLDMGVPVEDTDVLKTALIMDHRLVERNSLKNIKVVEPSWTYPGNYNSVNPLARDFYTPTTWYVMAREVHKTRLLTFVSRSLPDILKPAYAFGGLSMSQMVKPYVDKWLRTQESVSDLIHSFSVMVLGTDMSSILSGGAGEAAAMRALLFNAFRDNRGLFMIDKEKESLENVQTSLGTLDHLQAQAQEHMASISGEPLVIMTGISPSGLNASSEGELQVWAQTVNAMQTHLFDDNLKAILDVIQLDQFGDIDPGISHEWNPLEEESDQDKSSRRKSEADAHAAYITAGVLDPSEVRQVLATDPESPYAGVDLSGPPPTPPEAEVDPLTGEPQEGAGGGEASGLGGSSGAPGGKPKVPPKPLKPGDARGVRDAAEGDTIDEIARAIRNLKNEATKE